MAEEHGLSPGPKRRYGRILAVWLLGVVLPPGAVTYVLSEAAEARCDSGMTDCSWGLEVLFVLPVLLVSLLLIGPLAVYSYLRLRRDPLAGSTARWALVLVLAWVPLGVVGRGLSQLLLPVAVLVQGVTVLLPAIGGRYMAIRRSRRDIETPAPMTSA